MKKIFLATTLIIAPCIAHADDKAYLSVTGEYIASASSGGNITGAGVSFPGSVDYNNGYGGMIALGKHVGDFRAELEAGYRELKEKSESITILGTTYTDNSNQKDKAITGMVNLYYDIPTGSPITPYVGAGIGDAHLTNSGGSDAFAYQGMIGLNYKLSESSTIFGGYRYFGTNDFAIKSTVAGVALTENADVRAQAIDVGYRFSF